MWINIDKQPFYDKLHQIPNVRGEYSGKEVRYYDNDKRVLKTVERYGRKISYYEWRAAKAY